MKNDHDLKRGLGKAFGVRTSPLRPAGRWLHTNLGGSRLTVLRRIVIPYAMPGVVAGCIIVFMLTAGSYLTPILLGGKNSSWFTEQIYNQFITRYNWEAGATFGRLVRQ